jgi:predicted porin
MHALALLTLFAGAASAQSSVTIYGKIDQGLLKDIGSEDHQIAEAAGSRLGFKGAEDLGGGLSAVFAIEHRFTPDTGNQNTTVFWNGISVVGLKTPFGTVNIGRQYTPAFSYIQNQIDPFGGDTVAELRTFGMRQGAITKTRVSDSVRYDFSANGFNLGASIAEATQAGTSAGPDRPFSIAANYAQGPLFIGIGYEDPANTDDDLFSLGARYTIGSLNLATGFSTGTRTNNTKAKGFLVGLTYTLGAGEIKGGFARETRAGVTFGQKIGMGYHHNLSKRTKLYADVGYDKKATTEKTGYDLGIQHNF